jgi:16S rRNA (cytosine1402-N4)-methyltransferase
MTVSVSHTPVLLDEILERVGPVRGVWVDGTLGAGGYTRALLDAGAEAVVAIDRDPAAIASAESWSDRYRGKLHLHLGRYGELAAIVGMEGFRQVNGVVLDIGVSSMQIDSAERGFSFQKDGPLDMRMGQTGPTAAELVNSLSESALAEIIGEYGEERAARRIAHAIVLRRSREPFVTTLDLARLVEQQLPRPKPGQPHPATRTFQAIRLTVNNELEELVDGLAGAEQVLEPDGSLAVVTFHSLEDRIVKRFFQQRSEGHSRESRHLPERPRASVTFEMPSRRPIVPSSREIDRNPRARSAKLRIGRRLPGAPIPVNPVELGLPVLNSWRSDT